MTDDWRARAVGRSVGPAVDEAIRRGQAVVAAAARVVQRSGSADVTMRQVADEAGLSLRAVYKLFAGKDELLAALTEEAQSVLARLLERRVAAHDDPLERLGAALYFATDPRQHTDPDYNAALARHAARLSIAAPETLGRARRPVVRVVARLVDEAMAAGRLAPGDPEQAAASVCLTCHAYLTARYLGSPTGGALPGTEGIVEFCLRGLGAQLPAGWVERLRVSDEDAARSRRESERAAGTLPTADAAGAPSGLVG